MTDHNKPSTATEFKPLVKFEDQSAGFVHGFEAGIVWQRMQSGEDIIEHDVPVHFSNLVTFGRMAVACNYSFEFVECTDGLSEWMEAAFTKLTPQKITLCVVK